MQKLFAMTLKCWHGAEDVHTAIFLIALRNQPFVHDSVYFLISPVGQTAMLLAILTLVGMLHLRLTNVQRGRPIPHGQGTSRAETNRAEPKRTRRTNAAKPSRPRRSTRKTATARTPRNRR